MDARTKTVFSKVPEVTLFFWIIKVLCTTVGETAADFINVHLNLGLTITSVIMGVLFVIALAIQFRTKQYVPVVYWLTVVLISVFGTLVTDNLSDNLHVPLEFSTVLFTIALAITFGIWYAREKTLSIHSIYTRRREAFYWLAILFTFALGTASGDLMAEKLGLGYLVTGIIVAAVITAFAIAWRMGLDAIIAFWFIYIMTRPLGASLGDLLSQSRENGGLGLGPTTTTVIFVACIVGSVIYLASTKRDVVRDPAVEEARDEAPIRHSHAFTQLAVVVILLLGGSIGGYFWRHQQLQAAIPTSATGGRSAPLGDLSKFTNIGTAMLDAVNKGDWSTANSRANDLEYAWDNAQARLQPLNGTAWTHVDGAIDTVLRAVRSVHPDHPTAQSALQGLLRAIKNP